MFYLLSNISELNEKTYVNVHIEALKTYRRITFLMIRYVAVFMHCDGYEMINLHDLGFIFLLKYILL